MSVKSSKSTLSEIPGITSAVEHLQELGVRMRGDDFGFHNNDVNNIDSIIEAIQEAHQECSSLHEKLETETIKASVLRHKLHFYPGEIQGELQGAVDAARQSNAEELNALQQQLKDIIENTASLEKRHQELEKENAVLHPERDRVREQHEEIIDQLNQRLAEKASKQIILNETRDKLRETNQKIVDLEEGVLQLKEDLIQERADARMEKKRLKKSVYDTTVKTKEQKDVNVEKKKEVDGLHEQVMDSEGQLENIRKSVRRFETSRSRLEGQEKALSAQYGQEIKQNEQLKLDGEKLYRQIAEEQREFEEKKTSMESRLAELNEALFAEKEKNEELTACKADMETELKEKLKVRKEDELKVKEQNEVLQRAKENLAFKAEETARLTQENMDMERRIIELGETHEAIKSTLQKQIEEYRQQLGKERKERMDMQDTRDSVQRGIDDYRIQTQRYINEMNRRINEGKQKHDQATREGTSLQKSLKEDEETIRQLKGKLAGETQEFQRMKSDFEKEIESLRREITNMEKELVDKKQTVKDKTPGFQELEKTFAERTDSYEQIKKDIVAMKNKKMGLDESVSRAHRDLGKMAKPHADLKKDLRKKREASMQQLKKQAEETRDAERNIYTVGCKLKTAVEENARFTEANRLLESEIMDLNDQSGDNEDMISKLAAEFERMRGSIEADWATDNRLQEEFAARDELLVQELDQLLHKTERRENIIGNITRRLQSELKVLAQFLDDVARRRPKESSQRKRVGTARSARSESRLKTASTVPSTISPSELRNDDQNVGQVTDGVLNQPAQEDASLNVVSAAGDNDTPRRAGAKLNEDHALRVF